MADLTEKAPEPEEPSKENEERDERSIFVGNVDYSTSTEELRGLFKDCGSIERVTIPTDKFTKHPKGYAYIEFVEVESVAKADSLNDKVFKSRKLKILPKRNNIPQSTTTQRRSFRSRRSYFYMRPRGSRYRPY